jgi:hypothetical protein
MCVVVGRAFSVGVVGAVRLPPVACNVHTPISEYKMIQLEEQVPCGPRKSGMPAEVETPAP